MVIAIAKAIEKSAELALEVIKGQTKEQQAILWQRHIEATEPFHRVYVDLVTAILRAK
jgi:hypothetical protein